jgi:mono/diheme cytochrome c family protein
MRRHLGIVGIAAVALACVPAETQPVLPPTQRQSGPVVTGAVNPVDNAGKQIFDRWCSACHAPGARFPGTASLAAKYGKSMPAALEQRADLTPEVVEYFVRKGVLIMPPFRKSEITDAELRKLGTYLSKSQ